MCASSWAITACKLFFGESRERSDRQEHDGPKPSDHRRRLQPLAFAIINRAIEAEPVLQRIADLEHSIAHGRRLPAAFALEQQKPAGGTKAEEGDAKKPCFDQPGQRIERRRDRGRLSSTMSQRSYSRYGRPGAA